MKKLWLKYKFIVVLILYLGHISIGFGQDKTPFFHPADSLDKARFYTALGVGITSYTATTIGLYNTWYKQFDQSSFHFFNDWGEWKNMDKYGHTYTAYNLSNIGYQGARWTGLSKRGGLLVAGIGSTAIQLAIETMDGFSTKWGFSISDVGFNCLGTGLFIGQQMHWDEQKIRIKMFSFPKNYDAQMLSENPGLNTRIDNLFGTSYNERFLKDYNAQSLWISANIRSFLPDSKVPYWLNLAFGYSGENMFGGFENAWEADGVEYQLDSNDIPRYHQFMLSLDVDFDRIKAKSYFWRTWLTLLNQFKLPAPAIEYNSLGEWKFHLIFKN